MNTIRIWLATFVCATSLLASCGGGGGSGAGGSGPAVGSGSTGTGGPVTSQPVSGLTLWAGNAGGRGNLDGNGSEARFWDPAGIVADSHGNVFVVDNFLNTIRKITPDGTVSTFAGTSGASGSADGVGAEARFNFERPSGITIDKDDNLYVADVGNNIVRKITPSARVTTVAGKAGQSGNEDGVGSDARLMFCFEEIGCVAPGMAVDSTGAVYFVEAGNSKIRKITPSGEVRSVWGKTCGYPNPDPGMCFDIRLTGLAIDSADHLYIAERSIVRVMGPDGRMLPYAGDKNRVATVDGTGANAGFTNAHGLASDGSGTLYLLDGALLRKITAGGNVTTIAGDPAAWYGGSRDGAGTQAQFFEPSTVTVDRNGTIYIADSANQTIRKSSANGLVTTLAGQPEIAGSSDGIGTAARFSFIEGMVFDTSGNLVVSDTQNYTIRKITPTASVSTFAGRAGETGSADGIGDAARFFEPTGIAIDNNGNLYVADMFNSTIRKLSPDGAVTTLPKPNFRDGSFPTGESFYDPRGVSIDANGNLFIADTGNNTIRKIDRSGQASTLAGYMTGRGEAADGLGSAARFYSPYRLANDSAGNVFVCDTFNHTVRKITPAGMVTTFAGMAGTAGYQDGVGREARFYHPDGIAIDTADNLYIADSFNHVVRKITPTGLVTTVVGRAGSAGFHAGPLPGSLLFPSALAIKGRTLYIATSKGIAVASNVP
jgi:sugar lactone lactonase YvrE